MTLFSFIHYLLLFMLIGFFTYTLINKALDVRAFQFNIAKTGLFNEKMVDVAAYAALTVEAVSILLLVIKEHLGLLWVLLMMLSFTSYIIFLFLTDRYEICGCGGILNGLAFKWHLLINVVLLIVIGYLIYDINEE